MNTPDRDPITGTVSLEPLHYVENIGVRSLLREPFGFRRYDDAWFAEAYDQAWKEKATAENLLPSASLPEDGGSVATDSKNTEERKDAESKQEGSGRNKKNHFRFYWSFCCGGVTSDCCLDLWKRKVQLLFV